MWVIVPGVPSGERENWGYVTFFIGTYYLALSISRLLLFIFSLVISYFPYFKLVTLKTLVILCNTLKKEGRAFRNIGKIYPYTV